MTVECIACERLSRKDAPREFRDLGLLRCGVAKFAGEFVSPTYPRECARFIPAAATEVAARREWLAKRRPNTSTT